MSNPTDNQAPRDELDEILSLIQAVKHYPGAHSMKIVGKSEAKARLLQWGTRKVIKEWEQIDGDDTHYWDYREINGATQKVYLTPIERNDELQASLKDGGKTE